MSKLKTDKKGYPTEVPYKITECEEKELPYNAIDAQLCHLLGKILTIIDASIEDKQRNKAIKDLIKNAFSSQLDWIYQLCGLPERRTQEGGNSKTIEEEDTPIIE